MGEPRWVYISWFENVAEALDEFRECAAELKDGELIALSVDSTNMSYAMLPVLHAILGEPDAHRIVSLAWDGVEYADADTVVPLLIERCPNLTSLEVDFGGKSDMTFIAAVLEHPNNKVEKLLVWSRFVEADSPRFIKALGNSHVVNLEVRLDVGVSNKYIWDLLFEYLAKDKLTSLTARSLTGSTASVLMAALAGCTRLTELWLKWFDFNAVFDQYALSRLPKCVSKLVLEEGDVSKYFSWTFLVSKSVRNLDIVDVTNVNCIHLGQALESRLRSSPMDRLCLGTFSEDDVVMREIGAAMNQAVCLELYGRELSRPTFELLAAALHAPDSVLKSLMCFYALQSAVGVDDYLLPAIMHPLCRLTKLQVHGDTFPPRGYHRSVVIAFKVGLKLFALLQGRLRARNNVLRKLPVEIFRMVRDFLN